MLGEILVDPQTSTLEEEAERGWAVEGEGSSLSCGKGPTLVLYIPDSDTGSIEDTVLLLKRILKTISQAILEVGKLKLKEEEVCQGPSDSVTDKPLPSPRTPVLRFFFP